MKQVARQLARVMAVRRWSGGEWRPNRRGGASPDDLAGATVSSPACTGRTATSSMTAPRSDDSNDWQLARTRSQQPDAKLKQAACRSPAPTTIYLYSQQSNIIVDHVVYK